MWYIIGTGLQKFCGSGIWCPPMLFLTGKQTWKQGDICKQYLRNKNLVFMRNVNWNWGDLLQIYQFVPYIHVRFHNWYRAAQQFMSLAPHYGTELRRICYKMCREIECDGFVWTCCTWMWWICVNVLYLNVMDLCERVVTECNGFVWTCCTWMWWICVNVLYLEWPLHYGCLFRPCSSSHGSRGVFIRV
jgi:hypothetical protein